MTRLLALVAVAVIVSACDPSHPVRISNQTGETIILQENARNPQVTRRLEPGAEVVLNWLMDPSAPDSARLREVRATSVDGRLLFCRRMTYGEMRQANWALAIRLNQVECGL